MARKLLAFSLLLCFCMTQVFAQTQQTPYTGKENEKEKDKDKKPVVFRDRLIMDIYHTFWMGMPKEVNHMKFDPGFNVSAIWDFKIKQKPVAIGLGVGISYYSQYSDALLLYDETDQVMRYNLLPEGVNFNRLKMNYFHVNIPLEFRYRAQNGFKFTIGARAGLVCGVSQKYKGDNPLNPSDTLRIKNLRIENKMKYCVDVYARIGWKFVDVYYSFQATPMFTESKGPKIRPMSVGISLSIF
ncbi:MAG: outer membrane beta-barrel protein [Bacteroidales bacterium]|nr:outer membrane beta-barrel protein [Bacteroidales bacterium]